MGRITPEAAEAVQRLLARGNMSLRAVSIVTGISRGVVGKIAAGTWRPFQHKQPKPRDTPFSSGSVGRCQICRAKVYLPCRACTVREFMRKKDSHA